ncbi:MAG TPA: succinate dehydrogenase, cytochrome b556 subunit [Steroidobacteraceae bacterium]|jgi:succinate dehydrogenase / fumarate reductase cytochrome b subunit|nr:succinate dehydrogenase, cytochrome b556 subunit [Steroidobacteraceae bacterium]
MAERPLSPHVFHYKWAYTMTLSILHRVSGLALVLGLIGLTAWLVSISLGAAQYAALQSLYLSWPLQIPIAIAIVTLVYHFCNGLRHLAWDCGWGFERHQARRSAAVVVAATLIISAACLYFMFRHGAA